MNEIDISNVIAKKVLKIMSNRSKKSKPHQSRPKRLDQEKRLNQANQNNGSVPILIYGNETNFPFWLEKLIHRASMEYGLLANIFLEDQYVEPADVDEDEYDLTPQGDPHGLNLYKLKTKLSSREKQVAKMIENHPKLYSLIWTHLSKESIEAVLRHDDFDEVENRNDPLALWLAVKAIHKIGFDAVDEVTQRADARLAYKDM